MKRCKQVHDKFSEQRVSFIWFTDERGFPVAPLINAQNDRPYAPTTTRKGDVDPKRLLRTRPTFSRSVMVSMATKLMIIEIYTLLTQVNECSKFHQNPLSFVEDMIKNIVLCFFRLTVYLCTNRV